MLSGKRALKILFLSTLVALGCTHRAEAAMFHVLGYDVSGFEAHYTYVTDVSDDGRMAVGSYTFYPEVGDLQSYPRRWDANGDRLPTANSDVFPSAVSSDGSVLVGYLAYDPVLVEPDGSVIALGELPGSFHTGLAGISGDGSIVVGSSGSELGGRAIRWSREQTMEMVTLPPLPGHENSRASAISADGRIVVGSSYSDSADRSWKAVRWTDDGTPTALVDEQDHLTSLANDVSGDGSAVVGWSRTVPWDEQTLFFRMPGDEAFLWTQQDGIVGLGFLPGHGRSEATAISADGRVVVGSSAALIDDGESTSVGEDEAFIWDAEHGMRDLKGLLAEQYGLDMPDWPLGRPTGISADGRVIVGYSGGLQQFDGGAWMVVIPEPSTLVLIVTGLLGWVALIRRKRRAA